MDVVEGQVPLPGMPDEGVLFHVEPVVTVPDPYPGLSPDRRRTLRQRAQVAAGVHPLTGGRTRPDLGNCGTCAHRVLIGHHDRTYPKCELGPVSSGAATDVRRAWPACERYEARP
jgi:hypothetical protein